MTQPPIVDPPAPPAVPDPPAPPVEPVEPPPWTEALPEGVRGFAEQRGWKAPEEAIRSYQALEQLKGLPEEQLLRLPGDPEDVDGWNSIYSRLGRPDDAAGYELPDPGLPEGAPDLTGWFAEQAFAAGIPKGKAQELVANYNAHIGSILQEQKQVAAEQSAVETQQVMREWGAEAETNVQAMKRFKLQMGWDDPKVNALERAIGTRDLLLTLAKLGRATSESTFVPPDFESDAGFGMTPSAAKHEIARLKGDKTYMEAYMRSDKDAVKRMTDLQRLAAPEPTG